MPRSTAQENTSISWYCNDNRNEAHNQTIREFSFEREKKKEGQNTNSRKKFKKRKFQEITARRH